ncbi:diguanylate cyclase domain-containing protein [Hydrogenophilus thermoluteolus]|uniref:diguanylate cyclase domain-containing protein n=1 Tax=Hydrogenophilus thermoluteolus TaxID=297 RepID=UPI003F6779BB
MDAENRITAASAGLLALIGVDERGVLGQPFMALLFDADRSAVAARLQEAREQGETVRFSARLRCGDGRFVGLAWSVIQAGSEGWLVLSAHEVGVNLDNAARLSPELTDRLTGLPALALFLQRVDHGLQRLRRNPSARFAVVSLGLDRFHLVNHRFGYWAGDLLLTEVAHRLQRNVRPTDLVSRVGGDEFCVLLEDVRDVAAPLRVVQRWREGVAVPFRVGNHELSWGFSAGVAVVDQAALSGETPLSSEAVLSEAQLAMREAKRQGARRR